MKAVGYIPGINADTQDTHTANIFYEALLNGELMKGGCGCHRGKLLKKFVSVVHKT